MQFRPCFDQPALPSGQAASKQLYGIYRENSNRVLLVGVKVWRVVCPPTSTNMRMTMPKNRLISGTDALYRQLEVSKEARDSAPRLGKDEGPLAGSIQVRMSLIADPQLRELLGQAR